MVSNLGWVLLVVSTATLCDTFVVPASFVAPLARQPRDKNVLELPRQFCLVGARTARAAVVVRAQQQGDAGKYKVVVVGGGFAGLGAGGNSQKVSFL